MGRSVVAAVLVLAVACGEASGTAEQTTTTTTSVLVGKVGVSDSTLGSVLVDSGGMTLYLFTSDDRDSTCYDECAELWPPAAAGPVLEEGLDRVALGSIVRTDGTEQLTVNGRPVYLYAGDAGPGDVRGHGIGGVWFAIGADGDPISGGSPAAPTTVPSVPDDYDYGY
jgi:predicted lipoprotein with Yx(FWY)xxD motif